MKRELWLVCWMTSTMIPTGYMFLGLIVYLLLGREDLFDSIDTYRLLHAVAMIGVVIASVAIEARTVVKLCLVVLAPLAMLCFTIFSALVFLLCGFLEQG